VYQLTALPDDIKQLTNLRVLILEKWQLLRKLPSSICDLEYLQALSLYRTGIEDLPDCISRLPLTCLDLGGCHGLQQLPSSVYDIRTLKKLHLQFSCNLQCLPEIISKLTGLTFLDLGWCKSLESLPDALSNAMKLQHLNLAKCKNLKHLPKSFLKLSPDCQNLFC
jgi:Leucine-rich repeat (LRR) protein